MIYLGWERVKQRGYVRVIASIPFIYGMLVPLWVMDVSTRIYQRVCFPLYGITLVDRRKYVRPGLRGKKMMHPWDVLNCYYCGYANGVVMFMREVLAQTERYWCPLRHAKLNGFVEPPHHADFVPDNRPKELMEKIRETAGRDD